VRHLKRADPVLARVIERVGPCRLAVQSSGTHLDHIVRAIVYQQLSGKAARTIHSRLLALFDTGAPSPRELIGLSDAALRGAGLSRQKIGYLRDLAQRAAGGDVPLDALDTLDDEAVIAALTRIKGVGRWTAHMFLIFRLGRLNVLPELDLGIRKAIQVAYRLRQLPDAERVHRIGQSWAPYASVASWYLWRSLDGASPARRRKAKRAGTPGRRQRRRAGAQRRTSRAKRASPRRRRRSSRAA